MAMFEFDFSPDRKLKQQQIEKLRQESALIKASLDYHNQMKALQEAEQSKSQSSNILGIQAPSKPVDAFSQGALSAIQNKQTLQEPTSRAEALPFGYKPFAAGMAVRTTADKETGLFEPQITATEDILKKMADLTKAQQDVKKGEYELQAFTPEGQKKAIDLEVAKKKALEKASLESAQEFNKKDLEDTLDMFSANEDIIREFRSPKGGKDVTQWASFGLTPIFGDSALATALSEQEALANKLSYGLARMKEKGAMTNRDVKSFSILPPTRLDGVDVARLKMEGLRAYIDNLDKNGNIPLDKYYNILIETAEKSSKIDSRYKGIVETLKASKKRSLERSGAGTGETVLKVGETKIINGIKLKKIGD